MKYQNCRGEIFSAVQYNGGNIKELQELAGTFLLPNLDSATGIHSPTLREFSGMVNISIGDWIVKNKNDEYERFFDYHFKLHLSPLAIANPATGTDAERVLNEILAYIDGLTFDPSFNRDGVELCKDIIELHRDGLPDAGREWYPVDKYLPPILPPDAPLWMPVKLLDGTETEMQYSHTVNCFYDGRTSRHDVASWRHGKKENEMESELALDGNNKR